MIAGILFCLASSLAGSAQGPGGEDEAPAPVVVVQFAGPLNEAWAARLRRAREVVQEREVAGFILQIDTPGGEVELMKRLGDIVDDIGTRVPTVAFVTHRAWSAGAFMAVGCREIWMAPGASLGAAMPVSIGPGGMIGAVDEDYQEKILSAFRAEFRSWAEQHNRDPAVAEAFVDRAVELKRISLNGETLVVSGREYDDLLTRDENPIFIETVCPGGELLAMTVAQARELGYCEGSAADLDALLAAMGWAENPVIVVSANWSESLVEFLGSLSWLLLLGAAFFLVVSFNIPGMGAPEAMAGLFFALFLFHNYLVGLAEWTEVMLIVAGLGLFFVELFVTPGLILPGALGGVLLLVGILLSMQDFIFPEGGIEMQAFRGNVAAVLGIALVLPVVGAMAVRRFTRTRLGSRLVQQPTASFAGPAASVAGSSGEELGVRAVAGDAGVSLTPLRPSGTVEINGVPMDARSSGGFLDRGSPVRVLRSEGGTVIVAAAEEPA